jgi:hypothetical protein
MSGMFNQKHYRPAPHQGEVGASPALAILEILNRPNMAIKLESIFGPNRSNAARKRRDSGVTKGFLIDGHDGRAVERLPAMEGICSTRTTSPV